MTDINSLDIDKATAVLAYCLSNNWYEEIGYSNFDESYKELGKLFCTKKDNIKNFRDIYDPFTESGRDGRNQYTRDNMQPTYLRELLPELEILNKNEIIKLSKKIINMIWLPDLEKIWGKIKTEAESEKNRAELNLQDTLKEKLIKFLKNEKNFKIDDIGNSSISVTTSRKKVSHVIPFSYIKHMCIFKPFMEAIEIYHEFASDQIIHPTGQKTQQTYDKITKNNEFPNYNRDKLNEINFRRFILVLQDKELSGISKSIFRSKFDVISNVFCNKFNLENNKVGYVSSLLEFVFTSDFNLNDINVSSDDITIENETRNLILYGAPGTGKSYKVDKYVEKTNSTSFRTVFHSEYQNSDFIGSIKPTVIDNEISYVFKEGILLKALKSSLENPEKNVVLIIEEINRGDAASIFGDFFQLIDRDISGESEYEIIISDEIGSYLFSGRDHVSSIKFPSNFYLYATMNSSDQGVFQLDTAFKRRWDFEYLSIDFTNYLSFEEFSDNKILIKCPEDENFSWRDFAETINTTLLKENITEDRLLGPFFLSMSELKSEKLNKIIANKVLIYLWDDVLRHETKNIIFGEDYNSFSRLQSDFIEAKNVFSDNFIESLRQHKSSISNEVNEDIVTEDDNTEAE